MKISTIVFMLLCCLAIIPIDRDAEAAAPTQPMASSNYKIQGIFTSALSNATGTNASLPAKMTGNLVYIPEGSIDGIGDTSQFKARINVTVKVSGMDDADANMLKGFSGFPGFFPAVSPTDVGYNLYNPPVLSAPNTIYLPYNGQGNQVRYVLTGYTGGGDLANGSASGGMTTVAQPVTSLTQTSTITWNYKKQVRVSVATYGEDVPLMVYDVPGDTSAGSAVIANLSSTASLTAGMLAYGNGIPDGTTITAVSAANTTVTLSAAATRTFTGISGQRLTFAPVPADGSADPRECAGSDAAACAANAGAAKSGVHFYDATDSSSAVLTVTQSFADSQSRALTQSVSSGGGVVAPVKQLMSGRMTLTAVGLKTPLTVEWRYDTTLAYTVGMPVDPISMPCGTVDFSVKPAITILAADSTLPGDTADTAFVWAWDNSSSGSQRMKYFPIHPVGSFTVRWTCTDGSTFDETGRTVWPVMQKHIAGAPANLQPPGAANTFNAISYTTSGATAPLAQFNAASAGLSVIRFSTPASDFDHAGTTFIVVQSAMKPANDEFTPAPWNIGSKIADPSHKDPEGKTGYLFYNGGVYDGAAPNPAYDRGTRTGAIIPVNESKAGDQYPLLVVWYETGMGGIGWPTTPKLYKPVWPSSPGAITIGSGIPVSPTAYPSAMVYNQPDSSQPGFNPNEEHALITGGTLYALRDDLNSVNNCSAAYVLLKYFNASVNEWMMTVYKVARLPFTYAVEAGTPIVPPLPGSFQVPPASGMKIDAESNLEVGGQWHLLDHKGGHWAKAANSDGTSSFVMQWYYYMRDDFYWPFSGARAKKEGDALPFLNNGNISDPNVKPIDVTYTTHWPSAAPSLPVGDTLTTAGNGLPDLYHFQSAEVIFDENVYNGNGPLAKLYAPERYQYAPLAALPTGIKTEAGEGGMLTFPELPYAIQTRLFYDPANKRLGFKGVWISNEGETPWLLPNLMTAAERDTIKSFTAAAGSSSTWTAAADALYSLGRNPGNIVYPEAGQIVNPFDPSQAYDAATWKTKWGIPLGLQMRGGSVVSARSLVGEKNALTAGMAQGEGYVVIAENNDAALNDAPVALHVIKVSASPVFQGTMKAIKSKNVFDEKLTLHYTGDFGGEPEKFSFEWYYQPVVGGMPELPISGATATAPWQKFMVDGNPVGTGMSDITIAGASPLTLSDNWFAARYYYKNAWPAVAVESQPAPNPATPSDDTNNWSGWSGANLFEPMLAAGWIKRVVDGLNPLEARVTDFRDNATNTTVSMLSQFGCRYDGDAALNSGADNLNSLGLIQAYETVLNRGKLFSIDAVPPQDYGPTNDALLNISSRLSTFYLALGNEAYADAVDPTIGFSTKSSEYGNMAPSIFAFQNQADSLLEEELDLMRGRDDTSTTTRNSCYYNRLIWNFTQGEGEVAYAQNYNVTDQDGNGVINAGDAGIMYPQGHGDAWGHYLQAINYYYKLLGNSHFSWEPRVEFVLVAGNPIMVDYLDERKFASIAAARAKTGAELLDLTYRKFYTDDPAGQWQGYKDTYTDRAWGVDEWARRAGQAAYFDWVTANAILPDSTPATAHDRTKYVSGSGGALTPVTIPGADIQQIDRTKVPELQSIATQFHTMQAKMTEVDGGVNPLGLVKGVVPFDIDPAQIDAGNTHFEQIYARAESALTNAIATFDYANGYTQRLRQNQDSLDDFKKNLGDQERDYINRLIEIFGYPYGDDIGAGKVYPDGYAGPDIFHYNYVDSTQLTGRPPQDPITYKIYSVSYSLPTDFGELGGLQNYTIDEGTTKTVPYSINSLEQMLEKPADWTSSRRAPGRLQQTLSDVILAKAAYDKAFKEYESLLGGIDDAKENLATRYGVLASQITLQVENEKVQMGLDAAINAAHGASMVLRRAGAIYKAIMDAGIDALPKVVGTAADVTSGIRGAMRATEVVAIGAGIDIYADVADYAEFSMGQVKGRLQAGLDLKLATSNASYEVSQLVKALQDSMSDLDPKLMEIYSLKETMQQTVGAYQAALAEGLRLLDERAVKRAEAAADVQEYRYQDLGFRVFRNDAIQKYRAQFDLAARYVYLAATAYDYETNLLGAASGAGRKFLGEIARQRTLGVVSSGIPQVGFPGLADTMARLKQNFSVYKTQLGFNNPQTETTPFSLRTELFRIKADATSDEDWRNVLKDHKVADLWKIPEFRRYCRPFAPESAGAQPGIVIKFPTTVTYGRNFFGWPLSGGDSAYSTSNFSTRVRSVGLWFQNYNNLGLSSTPRVYLVPTGADILRSPTGDGFDTREWQVKDQKLPVPFPIGDTDLKNLDFIPVNDSLSDEMDGIRKVSDFRAYPYSGEFDPGQATTDSRLIGRSVWNTQWMMIIPGSTLLFNKDAGLNTFVNSVDDIKMFFQTYSYSGN